VSLKERCQNYFIGKRDHVQYERAIMAVRFTDYFVGTQFHPEADPVSFVSS
jgi:imidazoleglycerol phosphate synthase glutamine amidotransferase subunit HisH